MDYCHVATWWTADLLTTISDWLKNSGIFKVPKDFCKFLPKVHCPLTSPGTYTGLYSERAYTQERRFSVSGRDDSFFRGQSCYTEAPVLQ